MQHPDSRAVDEQIKQQSMSMEMGNLLKTLLI